MKILNNLKKSLCAIILSVCIFFSSCTNTMVYAAEPQMTTSTITYQADDQFCVYIPETIVVGEPIQISAMDINIDPSKTVRVGFSGFELNGGITIYNVNDPQSTLIVYFIDESGNLYSTENRTIGFFSNGSSGESFTFTSYVDASTNTLAGQYTGSVSFDIVCE